MTTYYEEGGKGRKQCPDCTKYVGVRVASCLCGHDFSGDTAAKDDDSVTIYEEGGKGRKQCPDCNKYVGGRVANCLCGYDFTKNADGTAASKDEYDPVTLKAKKQAHHCGWDGKITLTPAGKCPVKLRGTDERTVHEWCKQVISANITRANSFLCGSALRYFASCFYDRNNHQSDYLVVCAYVDSFFDENHHSTDSLVETELNFDDDILNNVKAVKLGETMLEAQRDDANEEIEI
jgi:hypothetical protein